MAEPAPPTSAQETRDSGLVCPVCEYNLTGLPENRCPECGETFDPDELRRITADVPMPATPWDRKRTLMGFFQTWWLSLTAPRRLAQRFPARHDASAAAGYSFGCYGLAALTFCVLSSYLPLVGHGDVEMLLVFPAVALGAGFACWMCEAATSALLATVIRPTRARQRYHFWRGLTHYSSGFTVLTGLWGGAAFAHGPRYDSFESWSLAITAMAIFCWWALALCRMVIRRSWPGPGRWLACLIVPAVGLAAIPVGMAASTFLARFCCLFR